MNLIVTLHIIDILSKNYSHGIMPLNLLQENLLEGIQLTESPSAFSLGPSLTSPRGHGFPRLLSAGNETVGFLLRTGLELLSNGVIPLLVWLWLIFRNALQLRLFLMSHSVSLHMYQTNSYFLRLSLPPPAPSSSICHSFPPINYLQVSSCCIFASEKSELINQVLRLL